MHPHKLRTNSYRSKSQGFRILVHICGCKMGHRVRGMLPVCTLFQYPVYFFSSLYFFIIFLYIPFTFFREGQKALIFKGLRGMAVDKIFPTGGQNLPNRWTNSSRPKKRWTNSSNVTNFSFCPPELKLFFYNSSKYIIKDGKKWDFSVKH